ncbi:MAG: SDR family NAD(P)-dependent oxidoreductase [Desulfobacterales bacterium]|nr:SDR family NAD(P)-dependent oxidoreductase [Desulfobacterales bacterium]
MNILITGGAGFIGSHTADALIKNGHRVRLLDNLQKPVHLKGKPGYLNPAAEFMPGDVRRKADWEKALAGMDAVYHLAAYQDYLTDFSSFFHTNTVSTALLYEVLVETGQYRDIRKVVVAASQAVMGEGRYHCPECDQGQVNGVYPQIRSERQLAGGQWEHKCPACDQNLQWLPSDEAVINPCNQYALSKHGQEQITLQLGKRYEIPSVVMRYSIVQGPRQSFYNAYSGAMRIFALALFFDRAPTIFEDGCQVRDFVNIKDVVDANLLVLEHPEADYRMFNVGGGRAWTVNAFYDAMQTIAGKQIEPVVSGYYRFGDTRHIFSDTTRLEALGWRATRNVHTSIEDYWSYLNRQQDMEDVLAYAQKHMQQLNVIRKTGKSA